MKSKNPDLTGKLRCECGSTDLSRHLGYHSENNGYREIYRCRRCHAFFSETRNTPLEDLKTPVSFIATVLRARNEGLGLRASGRVFGTTKGSITFWERRFASVKKTLMLYLFCHDFIKLTFEGDEVYTKVARNLPPEESSGWTAGLLERASRFMVDQKCGKKDRQLFLDIIKELAQLAEKAKDLSLFTDGERRYGNFLFEICQTTLRTGKPGRPSRTLPPGLRARVKNKGSQSHKRGRKRPKYQKPWKEHPDTPDTPDREVHANHLEAENASLRRRNSCYRRRANTYAKTTLDLQRTLDRDWIAHNFIKPHFTTQMIPAVALGIVDQGFTYEQIWSMQRLA